MAAFAGQDTSNAYTTAAIYQDRFVTIVYVRESNYYADNTALWPAVNPLIQDFKKVCRQIAERRAFCGKARERAAKGLDYKTPAGERGFWVAPEAPSTAPPRGVGYPRWKDFARRRG